MPETEPHGQGSSPLAPTGRPLVRRGPDYRTFSLTLTVVFGVSVTLGAQRVNAQPEPSEPSGVTPDLSLCEPLAPGCYLEADGTYRDPQRRYAAWLADRHPNYLRTLGWMGFSLAVGTLWYWLERDRNSLDWDLDSWRERFTREAYRYDTNRFPINWVWHPLSGAGFYAASRANDLGVLASATVATLTSFVWEFALEYRERFSINDTLVTPVAGIALGEYFHRLGQALWQIPGGGGRGHSFLRWTAGLPVSIHQAWNGAAFPGTHTPRTPRGWGTLSSVELVLGLGSSWARADGPSFALHQGFVESQVVAIPGYLRPGNFRFAFSDANVASLDLRVGGGGGHGAELETEAVLAGLYKQRIEPDGAGLRGNAFTLGTSVNFLFRRQRFDTFDDLFSTVGLPGCFFENRLLRGQAQLVTRVRMHGDFGGIGTPIYDLWSMENQDMRTKAVLAREGYYYGWGGTGRLLVEARFPWLRLGGSVLLGAYRSRQGLDREQEKVENDFPIRDRQLRSHAWLRFILPKHGLFLGLATHTLWRDSRITGHRAKARLSHHGLSLGLMR